MDGAAALLDAVLRYAVLATALAAGVVALTHWAVRAGHLPPFGTVATTVRRLSDPALRPVEGTLRRLGRNPQDAPLWLLGLTVLGGVIVLSATRWVLGLALHLLSLRGAGPGAWARTLAGLAFDLAILALIVRVIGSWFGAGRYGPLRPAWVLTDWLVEPIRRRLPGVGPIDLSPLVAWVLLVLARSLVLALL